MSKKALVIVESPTKAKTIRKFLPKSFVVEASIGHVRDLPQSAADIPAALKKEEWTKIGINVEKDFEPLYIVPKGKSKVIQDLKRKLKEADELYLATDEDREGESISWHLTELLKPKVPVKRMVFHEITKTAIEKALQQTREIDMRLVRAQETRRVLDRLVGYTLSPLIWKKIAYGLSAGRVQSSALRMIVERERERIRFQKASFWDIRADVAQVSVGGKNAPAGELFEAKLLSVGGKRVASGKDFDETTGKLAVGKDVVVLDETLARQVASKVTGTEWKVLSVEEKDIHNRPSPPFITSTLQQESNRKLGLSSRDTMRTAQALYEEGLITYMRTDSPSLSQEAIKAARAQVEELYGKEYLSPEPRQFEAKSKGAQEAHEAIRPAGQEFVHPKDTGLGGRELALYELIWKRTMATQMAEALKRSMSVKIQAEDSVFQANGTRILFPGFIRAYVEGADDTQAALDDRELILPALAAGDRVKPHQVEPLGHETKPPARFTEASLVQGMEKAGIGRPSTYASILSTIMDRGYVRKVQNALIPSFTGFAVVQLLENHFEQLVDLGFTSKMENSLDEIAEGDREHIPYLKEFYLGKQGLLEQVKEKERKIKPEASRTVSLPHLQGVEVKIGRFGAYLVQKEPGAPSEKAAEKGQESDEIHASIPEDLAPADLTREQMQELLEIQKRGPQPIGQNPETGEFIYCLTGRFGPYVQLGEVSETVPKPRRASVPKGFDPRAVTIEQALQWLSLPRLLGKHPQTGLPIQANNGRFGPYVVHDGNFRSLKKEDNVYTVSLERAVELLSQEKKGRGQASLIREVGQHPEDQKPVGVYEGKFGPYVKHGKDNASLRKEQDPATLTLEQAMELLNERAAAKGGKAKGGKARDGAKAAKAPKAASKAKGKGKSAKAAAEPAAG